MGWWVWVWVWVCDEGVEEPGACTGTRQGSGGEGRRLGPHPRWCYYLSPSGLQSPHLNPIPDAGAGQAEADPGRGQARSEVTGMSHL